QNSALNAAPFFYNASPAIPRGQKVPELQRNVGGVTFGGPLVKNKLLFFASYQGVADHDQLNGTSKLNVPLALTNDRSAGALENDFGVSSISPVALALFQAKVNGQYLIPTPSVTSAATAKTLGYDAIITGRPEFSSNQANANLDYVVSANDRLAFKYYYQNDPTLSPFAVSALPGFAQQLQAGGQVASLENMQVLSPTMTWEQKAGFIRQIANANVQQQLTPGAVGMNLFGSTLFPGLTIDSFDPTLKKNISLGSSGNFTNGGVFQNQFSYTTELNWVRGEHRFEAGFTFTQAQLNVVNRSNEAAQVTVSSLASFLAGNVKSTQMLVGSTNRYYRAPTLGAFAQDSWQVSRNLSVIYGLRWDYDGPL